MLELIFSLLNFIIPLIIAPVAIYTYMKIEKDKKILLLGIGFLFLLLAALEGLFPLFNTIFEMTESTLNIGNGDKDLWIPLFTFIGYVVLLIIAEPMKLINSLRAK
ncbi:MAG: hypothetical protein ACFFD4_13340 [Candidatus Odinarchaeota archaeon]